MLVVLDLSQLKKFNMEQPDKWLLIETPNCYKVFATWNGSYLGSNSWRINSGIESVAEDGDFFLFKGFSGSIYRCNKRSYGTTSYGASVLEPFIEKSNDYKILESWKECTLIKL